MPSSLAASLIFLAIALAIVFCVVLAERLGTRRSNAAEAQRKAVASGHPSVARRPAQGLNRTQREKVAAEAAGLLVRAGLSLARPLLQNDVEVHARGEDGDYVLHCGREYVHVSYWTNGGVEHLGQYMATYRAVQRITLHAGMTPRH